MKNDSMYASFYSNARHSIKIFTFHVSIKTNFPHSTPTCCFRSDVSSVFFPRKKCAFCHRQKSAQVYKLHFWRIERPHSVFGESEEILFEKVYFLWSFSEESFVRHFQSFHYHHFPGCALCSFSQTTSSSRIPWEKSVVKRLRSSSFVWVYAFK